MEIATGNIMDAFETPDTPRVMTAQQQGEAQLGYYAEKTAIWRSRGFWAARRRSGLSQEDFAVFHAIGEDI